MHETDSTTAEERPIPWRVIWLLLVASFAVILNETTMSVAIPALMADLHIDAQTAQWLTTGFMLTMAVVIPITGFLMNRFSTRQMFIGSLGLFAAGTLLAALAPGFGVLLVARIVQAGGTAIMMPLLMTSILMLVPMNRRGQVMGLVSVVMSMAPAVGPTLSGIILRYSHWRTMFWVMLPIVGTALVLGIIMLTNVSEREDKPIDLISVPLSALGFGGLVFALNRATAADGRMTMIISLVVAAVALGLFVWRQFTLDQPLLDLRAFVHRDFTVGVGMVMIGFMAMMGVFLVFPIYLQQVRHLDTQASGLLMLPGGLAMGLLGPLIGRLYDRFGARPLAVPAGVAATASLIGVVVLTSATTPIWVLVLLHLALSTSLAFMFTPVFTAALGDLPPSLYADGSALLSTLEQVAGAAGSALLVTLMEQRAIALAASGMDPVSALLGGTHASFTVAVGISAVGALLGLVLRRQARPQPLPGPSAEQGAGVAEG